MFVSHPSLVQCKYQVVCNKDVFVLLYYYVQHEDVMIYVSRLKLQGTHLCTTLPWPGGLAHTQCGLFNHKSYSSALVNEIVCCYTCKYTCPSSFLIIFLYHWHIASILHTPYASELRKI